MLRHRRSLLAAALALTAGVAGLATATTAQAATGCRVDYTVTSQWQGGFGANVTITNLGDPLTAWTLTWAYPAGQQVTQAWNTVLTQSGAAVTAKNVSYNGAVATGGTAAFGFNGSWTASNPAPAGFAVNGVTCTGGTTPTTGPTTPPTTTPPTTTPPGGNLPSSFQWSSTGPLIGPKNDGRGLAGIKDPSVVYYNGKYHVFASTAKSSGYNLVYTSFADWSQASSAPFTYLDTTPIGTGYRAAPEVFYFAPQKLWYLVYQTGNASYSTNPDIANPAGWSAPKNFYAGMPAIISQNIGSGYWVDMWASCDSSNCYLFSSDDNGHLYRSQTTLANFPNGMTDPVIALSDANRNNLFEASNVYKVDGKNQWLLIVEAIGSAGRYFRSWTSTSLGGSWTPLAATEANPFAGKANVTTGAWSNDISHGEMIRAGVDQTLTISPCKMQYLYQGLGPGSSGDYNSLPWRLSLLTQTNSSC